MSSDEAAGDYQQLKFRPLGPEDRESVHTLYEELRNNYRYPFGGDWTRDKLKKELVGCKGYGAFDGASQLAAFILYRPNPEALEIMLLATRFSLQGHGIMELLFKSLLNNSGPSPKFWLEVHIENDPALALYRKLGFKEQGSRINYYHDGKAALLFEYKPLQ